MDFLQRNQLWALPPDQETEDRRLKPRWGRWSVRTLHKTLGNDIALPVATFSGVFLLFLSRGGQRGPLNPCHFSDQHPRQIYRCPCYDNDVSVFMFVPHAVCFLDYLDWSLLGFGIQFAVPSPADVATLESFHCDDSLWNSGVSCGQGLRRCSRLDAA